MCDFSRSPNLCSIADFAFLWIAGDSRDSTSVAHSITLVATDNVAHCITLVETDNVF